MQIAKQLEKIVIRQDTFLPNVSWYADVYWNTGQVWKSWSATRTKKALLEHIHAVVPDLPTWKIVLERESIVSQQKQTIQEWYNKSHKW